MEAPELNSHVLRLVSPPLNLELAKVEDDIVVLRSLHQSVVLPCGAVLTHVNDEEVEHRNSSDVLQFLQAWDEMGCYDHSGNGITLELRFQVDTAKHIPLPLGRKQSVKGPERLHRLKQQSQLRLGFDLPLNFLDHFADIYNWDEDKVLSVLQSLVDEYYELVPEASIDSVASPRATSPVPDDDIFAPIPGLLDYIPHEDDYTVTLESRQLGMTIENVLERTVVRSIQAKSEASRLNVKTNSVILAVGVSSTFGQTHMETLDVLRNAVRPVKLKLRRVDDKKLTRYRADMQALIQRRSNMGRNAMTTLDWLQHRIVWIFQMMAIAEVLQQLDREKAQDEDMQRMRDATNGDSVDDTTPVEPQKDDGKELTLKEARIRSTMRCKEILDALDMTRAWMAEDARIEALVQMRLNSTSAMLNSIDTVTEWGHGRLHASASLRIVEKAMRDVCLTFLQVENDQQTEVRNDEPDDNACTILKKIISNALTDEVCESQILPSLWRLAGSTATGARIACAEFISVVYDRLTGASRLQLRGLINRLMMDSASTVRRYVLSSTILRVLDVETVHSSARNWVLHSVSQGASDEEADVRMGTLEACIYCIKHFAKARDTLARNYDMNGSTASIEKEHEISIADIHIIFCRMFSTITRLAEDTDVKVRSATLLKFGYFCLWMGDKWSSILLDLLLHCFRDKSEHIRKASICAVPLAVASIIRRPKNGPVYISANTERLLNALLPGVALSRQDEAPMVRLALTSVSAGVLGALSEVLADGNVEDHKSIPKLHESMLNVVVALLGDEEESVAVSMLLAIAKSLGADSEEGVASWAHAVFTPTNYTRLLPAMRRIVENKTWRIRKTLCHTLSHLVAASTNVERRSEVFHVILPLLEDDVFDVRRCAAYNVCIAARCDTLVIEDDMADGEPVQDMGRMWLDGMVLRQIITYKASKIFRDRIMALHMIATLLLENIVDPCDSRGEIVLGLALSLADDNVANVRIALAKVLNSLGTAGAPLSPSLRERIGTVLHNLSCDADREVSFLAQAAKQTILCAELERAVL